MSDRSLQSVLHGAGLEPPVAEKKVMLTVRLDPDVVAWLRAGGPGYQTRLNELLRGLMEQRVQVTRATEG